MFLTRRSRRKPCIIIDMPRPFRRHNTARATRLSMYRKHKRTVRNKQHTRRTRRKPTRGGKAGERWINTPLGPMTEKDYQRYQERLSPEAY